MKFKSFLLAHKPLVKDIVISTCLVGASAGVIFGISAGMFKIQYMKLDGAEERLAAYQAHNYTSENIVSAWNMNGGKTSDGKDIPAIEAPKYPTIKDNPDALAWWKTLHGNDATPLYDGEAGRELQITLPEGDDDYNAYQDRYEYSCIVIDGATHSTMDRSFNQSLYQGLVDFIHNERCDHCDPETGHDPKAQCIAKAFKPSQDNTTDFINTYVAAMRDYDVLGLAGFNHATPLNAMMIHKDIGGGVDPLASNADPEINKIANSTAFVLLDSNINSNQNVASVQFRADQPGFLSALATCQYLYNNMEMYHKDYKDLAVAAFGGVAIPTVTVYIGGFQRGIEFFNDKILNSSLAPTLLSGGPWYYFDGEPKVWPSDFWKARYDTFVKLVKFSKYKDEIEEIKKDSSLTTTSKVAKYSELIQQKMYDEFSIKMIKLGDFDTHFTGTFTAGDAIGITKQYLNRGASAIIAVAGPQSLDAAQEIQNQNSNAIVIGVDSAMEDGDYQRYHKGCSEANRGQRIESDPYVDKSVLEDGSFSEEANAIIKFSAVKDLRSVSNKITRLCAEGKNWDIDADPWQHNHVVDWDDDDTHILSKDDVDYETVTSDDNTVVKINSLKAPLNCKKLIIPVEWKPTDQSLPPMSYEEIVFKENCFANRIDNVEEIRFDCPILTFEKGSFAMGSSSKVKYLEFKSLASEEGIKFVKDVFTNWPEQEEGMLQFDSPLINTNQKRHVALVMESSGLNKWYHVKPNPYKSVCSTGFQTCSNILNGLISISWDGFIPLMQALNHLDFNMTGYLPETQLSYAWMKAAEWYFDELPDKIIGAIPEEYIDSMLHGGLSFITYNKKYTEDDEWGHKKGEPTVYYENYNHTMGILGKLLESAQVLFTKNMSLVPDGNGGFKIMDKTADSMTILDWLDYNMYMMS